MYLQTNRLIIRNYKLEDQEDLLEYMLQRVNAEFEAYPDFKEEDIDDEMNFRLTTDEFFAVELKANHKMIGNIYLGKREFNNRELGYVINTDYMRKGYMMEACLEVIAYFFKQGVHRIYAQSCPQNIASWHLMEKLGMKREGHFIKNASFRQDEKGKPIYWDTYLYAILNPGD